MPELTIWHNPRCSKSRQTLALIEESGNPVTIRKYLEDVPSADEIHAVLDKLGMKPRDLLRKGEDDYKIRNLANPGLTDEELVKAMTEAPKIIERPVVIAGSKAVLGRPPENAKLLLK